MAIEAIKGHGRFPELAAPTANDAGRVVLKANLTTLLNRRNKSPAYADHLVQFLEKQVGEFLDAVTIA